MPADSPLRELTDEQRKAILDLDPFFVAPPGPKEEPPSPFGPFKEPKLPRSRFVEMERVCPSAGAWEGQTEEKKTVRKERGGITAGEIEGKVSEEQLPEDPVIRYTIKALAFGGNLAAKKAAKAVLGLLLKEWGFKDIDIEDILRHIGIPELLKIEYKTATTTTISYSRSKLIEKVEETAITQHFFIQDMNRGMNVAIYYDTFFGTFAFVEIPACAGLSKITVDLPIFTWPTTAKVNENVDQVLPKELADGLKSAGARLERGTSSFEAAPASEYEVPGRFDKGLPPGLQLDLEIGKLSGKVLEGAGKTFQALFFVLNAQRERVAQLWVTVEVVEAVTGGPLRVETSASAKQVCSPNFSHELKVNWKVTGGVPPVSVTIEITGPDGKVETIRDLPLEGERKFQLNYPGGGSVKIKVIAKDASGSSSSAQASVQLGACQ